jgi:hypothetical protein
MEQLERFLEKLRDAGYFVQTNWQKGLDRGMLEHVTIQTKERALNVLFHVYEKDRGYGLYIESKNILMNDDLELIKSML